MARHEFGIMQEPPKSGIRYDEYEPQKYGCISVDDDYIADILLQFNVFDSYAHTTDVSFKGLVYCGITLIPPTSIDLFVAVIENIPELEELKELLLTAKEENKFVIHYGL